MNKFLKLSKAAQLYKQSEQNIKNIQKQYLHSERKHQHIAQPLGWTKVTVAGKSFEVTGDPHILSVDNTAEFGVPEFYSSDPVLQSFKSNLIASVNDVKDETQAEIDQALAYMKLQNQEKLTRLLKDVKGADLDEKISRVLDYDEERFKQLCSGGSK